MKDRGNNGEVIIVGAGPVGLTTALTLARHGVSSTVLEAGSDINRDGSRAIVMLRSSFETFDRAAPGVGQTLASRGVIWNVKRTYYKQRLLFSEEYPPPAGTGYPPFINISQVETDGELLKAAARLYPDLIRVRFGCKVVALHQSAEDVRVGTENGETFRAPYAVGADGASSTVRRLIDVPLVGKREENRFLTADITVELPIPKERRFYYSPPSNPGKQVSLIPQPGHVWRVDWQVENDFDLAAERASGRLDRRIRAMFDDRPYEIGWISVYTFNNLRAERFRVARTFLAGDAAHVLSPYGGRGMNSGIADAELLGNLLAATANGEQPAPSLDRYALERESAAMEHLAATRRVLRILVPPTRLHRWLRQLAIHGAPHIEACRRHIDSGPYATQTTRGIGSTRI